MMRAIVLGLLHGPTEMAPISSSAHTAFAARLWTGVAGAEDRREEEAAERKTFEVALHGGAAAALAIAMGGELRRSFSRLTANRAAHGASIVALSLVPPSLCGWLFEREIESRLGGVSTTAAGLVLGSVSMAIADRNRGGRTLEQAGVSDGLALGFAEASALVPGVSRRGATLAAARLRGFRSADADALSWLVGLPVITAACVLKGSRLLLEISGAPARETAAARIDPKTFAVGGVSSFLSTLLAAKAIARAHTHARARGRGPKLMPYCIYRCLLAGLMLATTPSKPLRAPAQGRSSSIDLSKKRGLPEGGTEVSGGFA